MESIERDVSNRSIKIKFNCISLINIYAYPRGANHPDEKRGDFFRKTLAKYTTREESCLVMGDFNTPVWCHRGTAVYAKARRPCNGDLGLIDAFKII